MRCVARGPDTLNDCGGRSSGGIVSFVLRTFVLCVVLLRCLTISSDRDGRKGIGIALLVLRTSLQNQLRCLRSRVTLRDM